MRRMHTEARALLIIRECHTEARRRNRDETERVVLRKVALEERVKQKENEIAADWAELEPFVERLAPSETLVINLRYYYGAEWREICQRIYGKHDDYELEADQYMDKMFRTHGRALLNLAELYTHKPA